MKPPKKILNRKLACRLIICLLLVNSIGLPILTSNKLDARSTTLLSPVQDRKTIEIQSWKSHLGEIVYQRGSNIIFFKNNAKFQGSQGISPVGTMIASPDCVTVDLHHLQNAQGNLSITDRGTNKRNYQPAKSQPAISDTNKIRAMYLPFSQSMMQSLKDHPEEKPLTWIDYSNNFGNPNYVSFARGALFYPTGFNLGKKFEQNFKDPLYSFIQYPDGTIAFDYVKFQITKSEKMDGYYDAIKGLAFVNGRQVDSDTIIFSATPIMINGKGADLSASIKQGMFQDLRQLFVLPPAKNPENARSGEFALQEVPKDIRAGIFFGLEELAANDYHKASQALNSPVSLPTAISVSNTQKITLSKEQIKELLSSRGYVEETDQQKINTRQLVEGKYFYLSDSEIFIFLKPSPYPQLLFGRTNDDLIFVQSIGGASGEIGITIKELFSYAIRLGLKDLFSVTQGTGSLLGYISDDLMDQKAESIESSYHVIVGASEGRQAGSAVIDILSRPNCQ